MLIYYVTFILTLLFSVNAKPKTSQLISSDKSQLPYNSVNVFMVFAVFTLFAGLRYGVGADWWYYYSAKHDDFIHLLTRSFLEPGWKLIGFFSTLVWDHYGVAMFCASAITIWLYIKPCAKYSQDFSLSVMLYFLLCWDGSFNGVRQYLAAAVLFAGHRCILEQQLTKWAIVVGVAACFHTTAIVIFPLYFIANRKLNKKQFFLLLIFAAVAMFSYSFVYGFLGWYKNQEVIGNTAYQSRGINLLRVCIYWIPIAYFWMFAFPQQNKSYDREVNFYGNLILLSALFMTIASRSAYLGRIGIYTDCYLLLAWPIIFNKIESKIRVATKLPVLLLYFIFWFYEIYTHDTLNNFQLWVGK